MVLDLQPIASATAKEISIPEFGRFRLLDFNPKQGSVYRLTADSLKKISDAAGFAANFESKIVLSALMDLGASTASFAIEISKNSRPGDVALRYSRDRWVNNDTIRINESLHPTLKSTYTARTMSQELIVAICQCLKINRTEIELYQIRINFKDRTAALIVDQGDADKLPAGGTQSFVISQGIASVTQMQNGENMTSSSPAQNFSNQAALAQETASIKVNTNSDSWKYSTYSQSEVDRLLKIQAENITSTLTAKITSQQKAFQDAVCAQEKTLQKIGSQLSAQLEELAKATESKSNVQLEKSKVIFEKSQNEFAVQLEQFQTDVDRTLMADLKGFDKRLQTLDSTVKSLQESKPANDKAQLAVILAWVAVAVSAINTVLLFVHH